MFTWGVFQKCSRLFPDPVHPHCQGMSLKMLRKLRCRKGKGFGRGVGTASLVAQLVKNLPTVQETWVRFLGWEDLLEDGNPLQHSCLENPPGQRAWWATVHGITKSPTRLSTVGAAIGSVLPSLYVLDFIVEVGGNGEKTQLGSPRWANRWSNQVWSSITTCLGLVTCSLHHSLPL